MDFRKALTRFFIPMVLVTIWALLTGWEPSSIYMIPFFGIGMAALTKDKITDKKVVGLKTYPVKASTKIYAGSMVGIDSAGYAVPGSDTAALKIVGVANKQADNSSGANGDINVAVEAPIVAKFNATAITQAMVGQVMYVVDDNTFDDSLGTNGVKAGVLVEFVSATEGWIKIGEAGVGTVLADIAAFTDPPAAAEMGLLRTFVNDLKAIVNKWL